MKKSKALIVDDNHSNIQLLEKGLKNKFETYLAYNGNDALHKLSENDFDIVLLDVNMPDMDGYEVCQTIRSGEHNKHVPIIFISALTSLEDKLKGYEAGGQDYIEKPVLFQELFHKMDLAISQSHQIESLDEQLKLATSTAMTAMKNSSELGIIISFMEQSFRTESIHDLNSAILQSISEYQLNCCVQIRLENENLTSSAMQPEPSKLEHDLLEKAKDAKRIITLGKRALFNSPKVSILIRDMPSDNSDLMGRLIDHLAVIVVAADSRCNHIETQKDQLSLRNKALDNVVEAADEEIVKLQSQFLHFSNEGKRIMSELYSDIEESLAALKLSQDQENNLYRVLEQSENDISELSDCSLIVQDSLSRIKNSVISSIKNMN